VPEELSVIDSVPEVPIDTDQSPDAEQVSALVEEKLISKLVFAETLATLADIDAVGVGSVISTDTESTAVPPAPVQEIL
jgi:hypothetical protein